MAGSPPPFAVKFRPRKPSVTEAGLYQQALDLTALVDRIIEQPGIARFHLKDLLDRSATSMALIVGRAAAELAPAERRRLYRQVRPLAVECGTMLDMLGRRFPAGRELVDDARSIVTDMIGTLAHLCAR